MRRTTRNNMFTIDPYRLPRIQSRKEAEKFWDRAQSVPGEPLRRVLTTRRDQSKRIYRTREDHIAFEYYRNPVVTYTADSVLYIRPYLSRSTALFANMLIPSWLRATYSAGFRINGCLAENCFRVDLNSEARLLTGTMQEERVRRRRFKDGEAAMRAKRFIALRRAHQAITNIGPGHAWATRPAVEALRSLFSMDEEHWIPNGLIHVALYSDHEIYNAALVLDGALAKEQVPLGTIPRAAKYDYLRNFI